MGLWDLVSFVNTMCMIMFAEEHNLDEEESSEDDRRRKETPAVTGSLSTLYGGDNELLRSQFAIYTSQEKRHQIVLLEVSEAFL